MTLNKKLLILIFALSVSYSFAQTKTMNTPPQNPSPAPPPRNIKMLPGYVHTPGRGIDTAIGKISKENGLEIFYDIGPMAGAPALGAIHTKEKFLWIKELEVNGQPLTIAYRKDQAIYANFGYFANFMAVIKTDEELADFLIMIMTYGSRDVPKNVQTPK